MKTAKPIELNETAFSLAQGRKITICRDCMYYKPFTDAHGYGECMSKHTFDGAFRYSDFCSYAKDKDA